MHRNIGEQRIEKPLSVHLRRRPDSTGARAFDTGGALHYQNVPAARRRQRHEEAPLIALNAIFRAKAGSGDAMAAALEEMARHVEASEPGTISFFVARDREDPLRFITYERFSDIPAMDAHNTSDYRDAWIARHGDLFEGDLVRYICDETSTIRR